MRKSKSMRYIGRNESCDDVRTNQIDISIGTWYPQLISVSFSHYGRLGFDALTSMSWFDVKINNNNRIKTEIKR